MKQFALLLSVLCLACSKPDQELRSVGGAAFGTTFNVSYYADEDLDISPGIDSVVNVVNQSVSTYLPDSDISKVNRGDSTVVIDQIFRDVFELSQLVHNKSGGYFDPTIGVLRNAYGFGEQEALKEINDEVIDSLRRFVGFEKVELTLDSRIIKEHPEIYFDFNAIAKGYGIDLIGDYLETRGITDYLVELGGEVLAKGMNKSKGKPWAVGIENTDSEAGNRKFSVILSISDAAMAGSGNYRKFRIDSVTGKKFVHTINPLTGKAEQSDVTSATVVAGTCAEADAYATTFMAMGLERSKALLLELEGIEAYLTYEKGDSTGFYQTPGLKFYIAE